MNSSENSAMPVRGSPNEMYTCLYQVPVYSHNRGAFRDLRNSNVLIYWPHGFGDWVQLSYVLPLLHPSNRYWITRFGDHYTAVMEGHPQVTPLYTGVNTTLCANGGAFNNRDFGIDYKAVDGTVKELRLPLTLYEACHRYEIDAVLWTDFPEAFGHTAFPFHSKARNIIRHLVGEEELRTVSLEAPLHSSINFDVMPWAVAWVESRLKNFAGLRNRKLCIVGRNGFSTFGKNWGHLWREDLPHSQQREGEECRDFMRLMLRKDPRWLFLVIEDRLFNGQDTMRSSELHAFSYAELFGTSQSSCLPFGLIMKVLANTADLCVGVPAGPYHLCMAKPELPTVGIWIGHLPSWYDEPKPASVHVISRNVREMNFDLRTGSFSEKGQLRFRMMWVDSRIITGEQVVSAVEELI